MKRNASTASAASPTPSSARSSPSSPPRTPPAPKPSPPGGATSGSPPRSTSTTAASRTTRRSRWVSSPGSLPPTWAPRAAFPCLRCTSTTAPQQSTPGSGRRLSTNSRSSSSKMENYPMSGIRVCRCRPPPSGARPLSASPPSASATCWTARPRYFTSTSSGSLDLNMSMSPRVLCTTSSLTALSWSACCSKVATASGAYGSTLLALEASA
uniref:Uncharacterized protein n=1 Tax=Arundo donax TaxID=35708 RepID=A0A0A9E859_ARUDO